MSSTLSARRGDRTSDPTVTTTLRHRGSNGTLVHQKAPFCQDWTWLPLPSIGRRMAAVVFADLVGSKKSVPSLHMRGLDRPAQGAGDAPSKGRPRRPRHGRRVAVGFRQPGVRVAWPRPRRELVAGRPTPCSSRRISAWASTSVRLVVTESTVTQYGNEGITCRAHRELRSPARRRLTQLPGGRYYLDASPAPALAPLCVADKHGASTRCGVTDSTPAIDTAPRAWCGAPAQAPGQRPHGDRADASLPSRPASAASPWWPSRRGCWRAARRIALSRPRRHARRPWPRAAGNVRDAGAP
jgi:hypothetical protein